MSNYDSDPLQVDSDDQPGGLSFTDNISVSWAAVDTAPDDAQLAKVNESNETFLRAVSVLGSLGSDSTDEDPAVGQEIARLDMKVNMLLDLVSQLVYAQSDIPPRTQVTVSANELQWVASDLPASGDTVFMQVYIQHGTPKPLCFYGEIISAAEEHAQGYARVNYLGLSGSARGWMEKLIFRHHRREVAYRRTRQ
ncbi:MAG: PilZ domain-containing protein [Halioglobus sp.]